ncbi:MAG: dihydropteroate synthase [Spirochaetaceae bacterium]|jgi:dihydropteroate synthase|nr:dihydropteroate synthase [Spirochaetaceae bacterium]
MQALNFSGPALVMAIINCNNDSFYAPSRACAEAAVEKALQAVEDGAAIIDFGAESTRPGAEYISCEEEQERLIPVISAFRRRCSVPVSVDTRKAAVARRALEHGADIINDISAMEDDPAMAEVCAQSGASVVLMHKQGIPRTMQQAPSYKDIQSEVVQYLHRTASAALQAGIAGSRIILDPGIGFGKTRADNLRLLAAMAELCALEYPVLIGLSRKSFIGEITGRPVAQRLAGTITANTAALLAGAQIIRVHDVPAAVDTVRMVYALRTARA